MIVSAFCTETTLRSLFLKIGLAMDTLLTNGDLNEFVVTLQSVVDALRGCI